MLKKVLLTAVVLGLASTATQAESVSGYVAGSVGQTDSKDFNTNKKFGHKVIVGLQANQYVALEAQYTDLGKPNDKGYVVDNFGSLYDAKLTAQTRGLGANIVGTVPLDNFKLFAKAGYHKMETKVKVKAAGLGSLSGKDREWVPSMGIGAGYAMTPELDVIAEYERYKDVADDYNVDFASVGLRYKF
ncbi:MAG: porin family protein [Pseudomonadaceae bacterium]|nr:porin family protein [Pseudomonadaceae bacterium]